MSTFLKLFSPSKLRHVPTAYAAVAWHANNPLSSGKRYRRYSPSAMVSAYRSVREEGMSVLKASKVYRVPESTLRDRVLGKVAPDSVIGSVPLFDQFQEAKIVHHFKTMADYGYGYSSQECVDLASDYAMQLGKRTKDKPLTIKWIRCFVKRWPALKVILKPHGLEHVRDTMINESTVMHYYDNLEKCIRRHDLMDKPHLIFNIDDMGISIDHKPPHIIACADYNAQSRKGKTVTVLGCGSATGVSIPPYFVFPGKRMNPDLLNGASPGAAGTMSDSGWSNTEVFRKYLETHFLKFVPDHHDEKILLLLDGDRSHVAIDLADWASNNNIVMFILPAHTSHLLQPLDVACYGPFERILNMQCLKVVQQTSAAITRYNICEIACSVYPKALCADNLQAAFRRTGIYPPDREAVPKEYLIPSEVYDSNIEEVVVEMVVVDNSGNDSDATVEGGKVCKNNKINMFGQREQHLKGVKNEYHE